MLSAIEASAHLCVIDAITDRRDNVIGDATKRLRIQVALEVVAPRCNCGAVLSRKPVAVGLVFWSCRCGWRCWEAS